MENFPSINNVMAKEIIVEFDYEREKKKRAEIIEALCASPAFASFSEGEKRKISEEIASTSIRTSPPEKEQMVFHLMTLNPSGRGGGKSTKAGNIRLNIGKLMEAVANGAFAAVSSYQIPWLAPFAFILLWKSLRSAAEIDLTENEAAIIYSMWVHRDRSNNEIKKTNLLEKVNDHMKKYGRLPITQSDLQFSVKKLVKIGSIQQSKKNHGNWWLCEWVQPTYR